MLKSTPEMSVKDLERRNALVEDMVRCSLSDTGLVVYRPYAACIDSY